MHSKWPKKPELLAQWSRMPVATASPDPPDDRRQRMVGAIVRTMQQGSKREFPRRRVYALTMLAAALGAALALGLIIWRGRAQSEPIAARLYTVFGASHAVVHGRELVPPPAAAGALPLTFNAHVATERASSSVLQLVSGAEVTVGPETRLTLPNARDPSNAREELFLDLGFIRARVPKLPKGHSFAIRTPNTLVSVHGTLFSVEVTKTEPSSAPRTKVTVTEGVVSVEHGGREMRLEAGMEWDSGEERSAAVVKVEPAHVDVIQAAPVAAVRRSVPKTERESAKPSPPAPETPASQTELAIQNRLFAEALNARDRGDRAGAVRLLDDFLRRYPASPLAQDAHVETFRILSLLGNRAAASREARSYLTLYPNGFAREEARDLALAPGF